MHEQVIDAIRHEIIEAEETDEVARLHYAKTVLGMALLQKGNQIMDPMHFCPYYLESERAFLAVLHDPGYSYVEKYLGIVRRMLANRPTMDIGEPAIAPPPSDPTGPPARQDPKYIRVSVLVLACCRASYLDRCPPFSFPASTGRRQPLPHTWPARLHTARQRQVQVESSGRLRVPAR